MQRGVTLSAETVSKYQASQKQPKNSARANPQYSGTPQCRSRRPQHEALQNQPATVIRHTERRRIVRQFFFQDERGTHRADNGLSAIARRHGHNTSEHPPSRGIEHTRNRKNSLLRHHPPHQGACPQTSGGMLSKARHPSQRKIELVWRHPPKKERHKSHTNHL